MTEHDESPASSAQALERRAAAPEGQLIRTPQDFTSRLQIWQRQNYHVLTPFARFDALPDDMAIVPTLVQIDPDPSPTGQGDVYQDGVFTRGEDVAIAKIGLSRIAQAAGMTIKTERTDDRRILNYWEVRATVRYTGIDGTPQEIDATEEHDLRDGSARIVSFKDKQLIQQRAKGLRQCEARAINAAIRMFGIKQKYSKTELAKPFVIVRVIHNPDMTDPETRRLVTERRMAGTTALYAPRPALPAAPAPEVLDVIGAVDTDPRPATTAVAKAAPAPKPRTVEGVNHDLEAGLYDIRLDGGEVVQTAAGAIADSALQAKKSGQGVLVTIGDDGRIATFALAPASTSAAPADAIGTFRIKAIEIAREGKREDDTTWRQRKITTTTGEVWFTFDDKRAALAEDAHRRGLAVKVTTQPNARYADQTDLATIELVDSRQQGLPMGGEERY